MPNIIPYVPRTITVHLGFPAQWAENVTVDFPTWGCPPSGRRT